MLLFRLKLNSPLMTLFTYEFEFTSLLVKGELPIIQPCVMFRSFVYLLTVMTKALLLKLAIAHMAPLAFKFIFFIAFRFRFTFELWKEIENLIIILVESCLILPLIQYGFGFIIVCNRCGLAFFLTKNWRSFLHIV